MKSRACQRRNIKIVNFVCFLLTKIVFFVSNVLRLHFFSNENSFERYRQSISQINCKANKSMRYRRMNIDDPSIFLKIETRGRFRLIRRQNKVGPQQQRDLYIKVPRIGAPLQRNSKRGVIGIDKKSRNKPSTRPCCFIMSCAKARTNFSLPSSPLCATHPYIHLYISRASEGECGYPSINH